MDVHTHADVLTFVHFVRVRDAVAVVSFLFDFLRPCAFRLSCCTRRSCRMPSCLRLRLGTRTSRTSFAQRAPTLCDLVAGGEASHSHAYVRSRIATYVAKFVKNIDQQRPDAAASLLAPMHLHTLLESHGLL